MDATVITREEAVEVGLVRFWDGVPCERGHIAERWVANCACVDCTADQLTPGQFAYIFRGGTGASEEFNDKRKSAQTWHEWEGFYAQWSAKPAPPVIAADQPLLQGRTRRVGAYHGKKGGMRRATGLATI